MKVKLKDIKPSPHRDFKLHPIKEEKVKSLETSIKDTGELWQPFLVRRKGDDVELVFGHHRLQALKNLEGEDFEMEVEVKPYDDAQMLRIMAHENDQAYNHHPGTIDEAVKGARDYLKTHPEAIDKLLKSGDSDFSRERIRVGAKMISKFLGKNFNLTKVQESIHRLRMIEKGVVDNEALYMFPTSASAKNFCNIVKELNMNKECQKQVAEGLKTKGTYGERSIYQTAEKFVQLKHIESLVGGGVENIPVMGVVDLLRQATGAINTVVRKLDRFKAEARPREKGVFYPEGADPDDISPATVDAFNKALNRLSNCIKEVGEFFNKSND